MTNQVIDLALDIQNLVVEYASPDGPKRAVDGVSLQIASGEFFALLGPNGAGKTSILSAITNLIRFKSGSIKIFGFPVGSLEARRCLGVVPQELVSHGYFNVREILEFHAGYFGIQHSRQRIDELLLRLGLSAFAHKPVSALSGGMKRRLLIAKALIHQPKLLLLDEPSAGVDVELRTILWDYMKELNQQGMTILLTTHYLEEAERLCERVAIMDHGCFVALDKTKNISKDGNLESAFLKLLRESSSRKTSS